MPGESSDRAGRLGSTWRSAPQNLGTLLVWGILLSFGVWGLWPLLTFYFGE